MKRPIKENAYNCEEHSKRKCYTPQLCDRTKQANTHNNKPFVPFIQLNEESFSQDFVPTDLLGNDPEKKMYARNAVRNIAKMICKENKPIITQNLENVS